VLSTTQQEEEEAQPPLRLGQSKQSSRESIPLTWHVLLPHLGPQRGVVALALLLLLGAGQLVHAQEGQGQGQARVALQHIRAVVADGVHRQHARGLVHRLCGEREFTDDKRVRTK